MVEADKVEKALGELASRETAFGDAANDLADAEHAVKIAEAKAFLEAEGSVDARKMIALQKCEHLHLDYLKKRAIKEFTKIKLEDAQQALSARQSLLTASSRSDQGYAQDRRIT